ncbi:hypothetical protein BaRGS_00036206, partial [Batillaria attramentaria]
KRAHSGIVSAENPKTSRSAISGHRPVRRPSQGIDQYVVHLRAKTSTSANSGQRPVRRPSQGIDQYVGHLRA